MRHGNGKVTSGVTSAAATKPKQRQHLGTYEAITKDPAKYEKMYCKSIASRIPPQILKIEIGNTDLSIQRYYEARKRIKDIMLGTQGQIIQANKQTNSTGSSVDVESALEADSVRLSFTSFNDGKDSDKLSNAGKIDKAFKKAQKKKELLAQKIIRYQIKKVSRQIDSGNTSTDKSGKVK